MKQDPLLSILVLSCKRIALLKQILPRVREHFIHIEPHIGVQWICFDNGSLDQRKDLVEMDFDLLLLSRANRGQGCAVNQLFSTIRTPYFMLLEDDWELRNPEMIPFVSECLKLMTANPKIASVKLDACHFLSFSDSKVYEGPYHSGTQRIPFYIQNPDMLWGGFCFPPSITRTDAMLDTLPCPEDQPFRRGWAESYCSAKFSRKYNSAKSPSLLLFRHIGVEPSLGWKDQQ